VPTLRGTAARRHRRGLVGIGALLAVLLAGCGGEDAGAAGGTETVTLGLIPIVDVAPVYLGIQQGFFEQEGIGLELSSGQGGAAIVPGVASGSLDLGFGNNTSTLLGASKGLPLKVVASGVYGTGTPGADYVEVMVTGDSPMRSAADLVGKKVAVNTLQSIGDTTVRASVRAAGGDAGGVEFVEMPFPNMNAALAAGDVDAIWQVEPFLAMAKADGHRILASPFTDTTPELMVSTYFTTRKFAQENPELVARFTTAIEKSLSYARDNPDAVRAIIPTYLDIPAELAAELVLPKWTPEINRTAIEVLAELAERDGLVTTRPDLQALLG
jgi:NitT/TauT family transport system substrate-binding protein